MNKKSKDKINIITEVVDITSGILSTVNPAFSTVPIISFAINRVVGLTSEENITKKLKKIEKRLYDKKITLEQFKNKIFELTEHNEYVVKNNLNNILLNCIPETVDIYIDVVIDLIMKQENSIYEEISEIINQINKNDLLLLKMIQKFKENGIREEFEKNVNHMKDQMEKNKQIDIENESIKIKNKMEKIKFIDRNIRAGENTIFWKDFAKTYELECCELSFILLYEAVNDNGERSMDWAYLARAFLKLERLGILQMDCINTIGTINSLNIDRFHITLFGLKLLGYI